jgi:HEAT repeat protein
VSLLEDRTREDRSAIVDLLAYRFSGLQARAAMPALVRWLESQTGIQQARAAIAIGAFGPDAHEAIPPMLRLLHSDPRASPAVCRSLKSIITPDASCDDIVAFLAQQAVEDQSDCFVRCAELLPLLGKAGEPLFADFARRQAEFSEVTWLSIFHELTVSEDSVDSVRKLLGSPVVKVRLAACKQLRKFGPAARCAVPALKCLLQDPDDTVARHAAVALLAIEETVSDEAKNALVDIGAASIGWHLQEGEISRKQFAQLRPQFGQLIQDAMDCWRRPNGDYSMLLFELLSAMGENADTVLPDILDLCRDDAEVFRCRRWLFLDTPQADRYWRSPLREPQQGPATGLVVFPVPGLDSYLGSQGKSAFGPLSLGLKDPEPKVRFLCLLCTQFLGTDVTPLANELHAALLDRRGFPKDDDTLEPAYLIEALQAISRLGAKGKPLVKDIGKLLQHKDSKVQAMAAWTLGMIGEEAREALDALERVPEDADLRVVITATEARMRIDGKVERAVQRLQVILTDRKQHDDVREESVAILCRLGSKARTAMDTFAELAQNRNSCEPVWAARAYRDIARDNQMAVSLCISILDGPRPTEDVLGLLAEMDNIDAALPAIYDCYLRPGSRKEIRFTSQVAKLLERAEEHAKSMDGRCARNEPRRHITPEHLDGGIGP